jgi:hypothetical protein
MSENGLYPKGPSDAERKAYLAKLDDEREARWEREAKAKAERDRVEREARLAALAAEREAEEASRLAVEEAAVAAMSHSDLVRLVRSFVVRLEKVEAANVGPSGKAAVGAGIDVGQLANGTASGAREPIVVEPNMERHRADQKAQLSRLGYGR